MDANGKNGFFADERECPCLPNRESKVCIRRPSNAFKHLRSFAFIRGCSSLPREVAGELPGGAAAAAARLGELEGGNAPRLFVGGGHAEVVEPVACDGQVFVLIKGIEGEPDAEAVGEGDLLFDG